MATETDQRRSSNGHGRNLSPVPPQLRRTFGKRGCLFETHHGSFLVQGIDHLRGFLRDTTTCQKYATASHPPSRIRNMNSICPRSVARFEPSMSLLHNQPRVPRSGEIFPDWLTKTNTAASLHLPGPIQERDLPPKRLLRLLESFQTMPQSDGRSPSH